MIFKVTMLRKGGTFLRLFRNKHPNLSYSTVLNNTEIDHCLKQTDKKESRDVSGELKDKILYSTYLESKYENYGQRTNRVTERLKNSKLRYELKIKRAKKPTAISLKYFTDTPVIDSHDQENSEDILETGHYEIPDATFHLPYDAKNSNSGKSWMTDYDNFDDAKLNSQPNELPIAPSEIGNPSDSLETNSLNCEYERNSSREVDEDGEYLEELWKYNYGEPDPSTKVSNVPCGGCGALLHCKDTSLPGFLPKEIFLSLSESDLKATICQRCHFLKEYNVALNINVDPAIYPKLLSTIKPKRALTILMVDLLDFPCSIWPGIMDIVGERRPIIVVGNKVDLLPHDSPGYLKHMKTCLSDSVKSSSLSKANIKHVELISAKTGYGVEKLINQLHSLWNNTGDVYLIGCTNVGKSTLFNALLQSDFCKVDAVDLMQRATVSAWPGTTLNLLKFPILKPAGWRLALRSQRLIAENTLVTEEAELLCIQKRKSDNRQMPVLMGHIGRTFVSTNEVKDIEGDPFSYTMSSGFKKSSKEVGVNEKNSMYTQSRWCYDTPGVVHPDQILSILTVEEIMLTLPKYPIKPRTFYMQKDTTLFLAGLGRIDFLKSKDSVRFTVFASYFLPVTICKTADADEMYNKFLGTEYFVVPFGGDKRLKKWTGLQKHKENIVLNGISEVTACSDVILSSAGWVSFTPKLGDQCVIDVWTPDARGIHVRTPSLIQHSVSAKGPRIEGTPAYKIGKRFF